MPTMSAARPVSPAGPGRDAGVGAAL